MSEAVAVGVQLNEVLAELGTPSLEPDLTLRFETYALLLMRWNTRTNLTAVRDTEGILRRHFAESIACARALPRGISSLLDFGSGAGFPGLPIALCRPEIAVTLAESQGKKAAFLREAVRVLGLTVTVHGGRAETLGAKFDCVTLRAVDRMEEALRAARALISPGGRMAVMTSPSEAEAVQAAVGEGFRWEPPQPLFAASAGVLLIGVRN